jgi:hypothetical protein
VFKSDIFNELIYYKEEMSFKKAEEKEFNDPEK